VPAWTEAGRRAYYRKKYGEEEGETRYQQWVDERERNESVEPQTGRIVSEKAPTRRTKKPNPKEIQSGVALLIASVDIGAANTVPSWGRVSRLSGSEELLTRYFGEVFGGKDTPEVDRLAEAITQVVKENRWIAQLFETARKSGGWLKLAAVLSSIMIPRMIQAGLIPNPFGAMSDAAPNMEGGGAYGPRGDDGFGQVTPDEPSPPDPAAFRGPEEQGGFGPVPGSEAQPHGRRHGRSAQPPSGDPAEVREAVA